MQKIDDKINLIEDALSELADNSLDCHLCPRICHINRHKGETGFCGVGNLTVVSSYCLHFGEEPCLSGYYDYKENLKTGSSLSGSGTVFFSGCNLKCIFCQNYQISSQINGSIVSYERLASIFLFLQEKKALNINLVTPTHVILPILEALKRSFAQGLTIPVVYNTSAYESYETISKLAGIIDIYLPDFKYIRKDTAFRYSNAPDYPERAAEVIKEMYRQVGDLELDDEGNAKEGLIIRHLILPGCKEESCAILEWIAANISTRVCLSLMSQFHPCKNVPDEINRGILQEEYNYVLAKAEELGFENVYIQPYTFSSKEHLIPDFDRDNPFPHLARQFGIPWQKQS
jgi:putative pyruvate formate lyase activating enzyme